MLDSQVIWFGQSDSPTSVYWPLPAVDALLDLEKEADTYTEYSLVKAQWEEDGKPKSRTGKKRVRTEDNGM